MTTADEIIKRLKEKGKTENLEGMARYGMAVEKRLGVPVPEMRRLAKGIGKDHGLAQALWSTGICEARILASMVDVAERVTEEQMEQWAKDFNSWDVCDQVCMNLFDRTRHAWTKAVEWSGREEEFVKRAAYALIACLAWHDKGARDERFIGLMPVIIQGATDGRNFVKKAVSWALRSIGKRNPHLNRVALETAGQFAKMGEKPAKWIASEARRDLTSDATRRRWKSG